ncbi:hypothetical protein SISSUDRAFT_1059029 [Sistotremastrum suecicum HHB10207 ss-3]|uniref:Protein kinase domain-containing protein n=1 Tax=Sistotremastrum suecicum HHB10207 ss-3 TaxID=1314776 RepID=A0A166GQV7_9AGAM|nr:hypothetical protein SISSUDRAFT_1059029 [Sistotremastrum suecicum HHB10207 ss-3]
MPDVLFDSVSEALPSTLASWRRFGTAKDDPLASQLWESLRPWLVQNGYHPWQKEGGSGLSLLPPSTRPGLRSPDGFVYTHPKIRMRNCYFPCFKAILWPARTTDGRDVVIRLIQKGNDGAEHLNILRTLARGEATFHSTNHCVPLLHELLLGDMIFGVFPYLGDRVDYPWFWDVREAFDFIIQALEGVAYLHEHLVAHLDIDIDNFLFNYIGEKRHINTPKIKEKFRCYFPVRYYLGDMELSVMFSPDSDPASRKIAGHPLTRIGVDPAKYGRELVPEMSGDEPYCPFKADMWQFGNMLGHMFEQFTDLLSDLFVLIGELKSTDPEKRPTATQAMQRAIILREQAPPHPDSES